MAVEDLNPALWGTLPKELLHFVFQRLPAAQISEIRLLSKAWNSSIDSGDSYFRRLLEETVYPHMFGLVSKDSDDWCVRVFDAKADRWHIQEIVPSDDYAITVGAADGGLVCFVSESTENPLAVVVMNPLTGKKTQLPPLVSIYNVLPTIQPSMVQLTMDRQTNQYQVLVVGYIQSGNRGLFAQVYDSQSKQWSVVGSGEQSWDRILGCEYAWEDDSEYYSGRRLGPCLYDFAEGQLHRYNGADIAQGRGVKSFALLKDRLFVLHRKKRAGPSRLGQGRIPRKYYISEYHLRGTAWVKVETHGCDPFDDYPEEDHHLSLYACNGFLMVIGQAGDLLFEPVFFPEVTHDKYEHVWLYSLSTHKWHRELPKVPGLHDDVGPLSLMCELRWSAIP